MARILKIDHVDHSNCTTVVADGEFDCWNDDAQAFVAEGLEQGFDVDAYWIEQTSAG